MAWHECHEVVAVVATSADMTGTSLVVLEVAMDTCHGVVVVARTHTSREETHTCEVVAAMMATHAAVAMSIGDATSHSTTSPTLQHVISRTACVVHAHL